jgi:hypothetical protein
MLGGKHGARQLIGAALLGRRSSYDHFSRFAGSAA